MWLRDIQGQLSVPVLSEYLDIWDLVQAVALQPDVEDIHKWRFDASGQFTTRSAYEAFFNGTIYFSAGKLIWGTWAPRKCKFFLWLVAHNRCWTADRLARRGLPHPEFCPLCDQEEKTINHLLSACVFARQFWHRLLGVFRLQAVTPQPSDVELFLWWQQAGDKISAGALRGFNTLVVLGTWTLWRARNDAVFEGITPSVDRALLLAREDAELWMIAGAKGLSAVVAVALPG